MSHKDKIGLLFGHEREKPLNSITYSDPIFLQLSDHLSYQLGYLHEAYKAQVIIQDINYISVQQAELGNNTTVTLVPGPSLDVSVIGEDITITVTPTTTATDVSLAVRSDIEARALINVDLVGTDTNIQVPQATTSLSGGLGFSADVFVEATNVVQQPRECDWVQIGDIDAFIDGQTHGSILEDVSADVGPYRWARLRIELIEGLPGATLYGEFFTRKDGDNPLTGGDFEGLASDIYFDNDNTTIAIGNNVQVAIEQLDQTLAPLLPDINRIDSLPFAIQLSRKVKKASNMWLDNNGVGSNQSPILIPFDAEIIAVTATCPDNETFDLEVYRNADVRNGGTPTLANALTVIGFSSSNSESIAPSVTLSAGDEIGVYLRGDSIEKPTITIFINRR